MTIPGLSSTSPPPPLLAVVIISVGAPLELAGAVRSILDQDEPVELIVVNSGGGDVALRLPRGEHGIRVISEAELLWAGAARNRGIDASQAPFVAFLASDCLAEKGWVAGRLRHHLQGRACVASAIANAQPDSTARLAHMVTYGRRDAGTPERRASRFGASYARWLFDTYGRFREDLRIGEDSEFHLRLDPAERPIWDLEIRTAHRNPTSLLAVLRDRFERGRRQGRYWPAFPRQRFAARVRHRMVVVRRDFDAILPEHRPFKTFPGLRVFLATLAFESGCRLGARDKGSPKKREARALAAMETARWREAARLLKPTRKLKTKQPRLALYGIICAARDGQVEAPRKRAEAAALRWPDNPHIAIRYARLVALTGNQSDALRLWDEHLQRFGQGHAALWGRAAALTGLGRFDDAVAAAEALDNAFPLSPDGMWARFEVNLSRHDWDGALADLTTIHDRFGQTAALERKIAILASLGRVAEAEATAGLLERSDLKSYLRVARHLTRATNGAQWLANLADQHAVLIGSDPELLGGMAGALESAGAIDAALTLVNRSRLPDATVRPQLVSALLAAGRHADAWAAFCSGSRKVKPYRPAILSALISAGAVAGSPEDVADLLDRAARSSRPGHKFEAMFQGRRLADLEALRASPPKLFEAPTPDAQILDLELPSASAEMVDLFRRARQAHPRFHAAPSFVLNDAVEVAAAIVRAADRSEPLSLIRLGDGEGNQLPYSTSLAPFKASDQQATMVVWFGEAERQVDPAPIQHALAEAIRDADIVGIPELLRILRYHRSRVLDALEPAGKNVRGLRAVLDFTVDQVGADRLVTSCQVHQSLSVWGLWDLLLPRIAPVSVITCHEQLAPAIKQRFGAEVDRAFLIPAEQKHADLFATHVPGLHYPDRFEALREELRSIRPGQVVLVAAGALGKIYCQWIKAAGGIGIDVGSAADVWAGYYTRAIDENASYAVLPGAIEGLRKLARHDPRVAAIVG